MKNILVILTFVLGHPFIGYSQSIQHYRSIVDTTHNTLLKLEALDSILSKSFRNDNDTFIAYSIQYINLAKEIDSIEPAARKAMNLQYTLTSFKNNPQKALKDYSNALNDFGEKDSIYVPDTYLFRGQANSNLRKFAQAGEDFKMANSIVILIKDNGIGYNFTEKYIASNSLGLKTLLERD